MKGYKTMNTQKQDAILKSIEVLDKTADDIRKANAQATNTLADEKRKLAFELLENSQYITRHSQVALKSKQARKTTGQPGASVPASGGESGLTASRPPEELPGGSHPSAPTRSPRSKGHSRPG